VKIIALKKGDKLVQKITEYIEQNKIKSGLILGLGALQKATLMLYDLEKKEYLTKEVEGPLEVANLTAIIAKDPEGKPHIHPHITLANRKFETFSGHLKEATIGATLEIAILQSDKDIKRYADSEIGLNLIR